MNKFEELMANGDNITQEQIHNALTETVRGFKSLKELNDFLTKLHPSDAYKTIRDIVHPQKNITILNAKKNDVDEYKRFQDIQQESKKIFDYESRNATIFDVQNISTNVAQTIAQRFYNILLRMITKLDDELGRVEVAVNTIEEHNGMSVTKFEEEDKPEIQYL